MAETKPIALITGGGYLGTGVAEAMAADGWRLILVDLNKAGADVAAEKVGDAVIETLACDIRDFDAVQSLVADAISRHAGLGGLVTAAGAGKSVGPRWLFWKTDL
jgi:NAD(P)-dependent dehydrogenase (short-subunit alcohol dehydrogenase family)